MDYRKELEIIEERYNNKKLEKAKLEERKRKLEEDKKKVLQELEEEGFLEEELEKDIKKLEKKLIEGITECQKILE